jgi:16S rRNA (cytosine1402-N4)-methyltransferase
MEKKLEKNQLPHIPVLLSEVVQWMNLNPQSVVVDATIGLGGHSAEILKNIPHGKLIGLDQDEEALDYTFKKFLGDTRVMLFKSNFSNLVTILNKISIQWVDAVLMDIGISSFQLDFENRGFSFNKSQPLDMRMDQSMERSAEEVVNEYSFEQLEEIFRNYGEEPHARAIAYRITQARKVKRITQTNELAQLIRDYYLKKFGNTKHRKDPATLIFQAIRIEVNQELKSLQKGLDASLQVLRSQGRLLVISFQSLEDRIVKQFFKTESKDCICPSHMPQCICHHRAYLEILTKKPVSPTYEEIKNNSRARSARLRVAQKL